jgi:N-acetylglucosaminyldiphosphoundecaprenol N-acetyl-beta-D-mannosaminyltransferase
MPATDPTDPFSRDVHCVLGLPFDAMDLSMAEMAVRDAAGSRRPLMVSTPNLNFVIGCQFDPAFRASVIGSDVVLADGMPLVWIAKLLRIPIRSRVAGSDLFERLRASRQSTLSVYFFGGPEGAAAAACRHLNGENGGLQCVGYHYPGFASIEDMSSESLLHDINDSDADFLVVALGAKKGQAWIMLNRNRLQVPVVSHLGAVVNFAAGTVRRAPIWAQRCGLEWLWRIMEEPALWRRYAGDGLSLCRLLITNVIPNAIAIWFRLMTEDQSAIGHAEIVNAGQGAQTLRLSGAFVHRTIDDMRPVFTRARTNNRDLTVDLGAVTDIDSAGIGILLLLQHLQEKCGLAFSLSAIPNDIRRQVRLSGASPLLKVRPN